MLPLVHILWQLKDDSCTIVQNLLNVIRARLHRDVWNLQYDGGAEERTSSAAAIACRFATTTSSITTPTCWRRCRFCCVPASRLHPPSQVVEREACQPDQCVNGALVEVCDEVPVWARHALPTPVSFVALGTCWVGNEARVGVAVVVSLPVVVSIPVGVSVPVEFGKLLALQVFLEGLDQRECVRLHELTIPELWMKKWMNDECRRIEFSQNQDTFYIEACTFTYKRLKIKICSGTNFLKLPEYYVEWTFDWTFVCPGIYWKFLLFLSKSNLLMKIYYEEVYTDYNLVQTKGLKMKVHS